MTGPDVAILTWLAAHRLDWLDWVARGALSAGTNEFVLAVIGLAAAAYVAVRRRWTFALTVVGAVLLAAVASTILKLLIGRHRPPANLALVHVGGYSMPSTDGAVTAAAAFAVFLALGLPPGQRRRLVGAALLVAVALIGITMVYLGAHWSTDVLAGWAVGIAAAWVCYLAAARIVPQLSGSGVARAAGGDPLREPGHDR